MKLWQKDKSSLKEVEAFTVGRDKEFDLQLAPFDILGSIAHVMMLESKGLLEKKESEQLVKELREIYRSIPNATNNNTGNFSIAENVEDIHSQVEFMLTQKLGDTGKKNSQCPKQE